MNLDELKKETLEARQKAGESYKRFLILQPLYQAAERDYLRKSKIFQDLDYQLALLDGRLKKIPSPSDREQKQKKQPELTLEQLKSIAEKLGFDLTTIEEPEEELNEEDESSEVE